MHTPDLLIAPEPRAWGETLHRTGPDDRARAFRAQLGIPDGPVVLTGHQAELWHPGILAKYLAADAAARASGASPARLVVDQDENDPLRIRCPIRGAHGILATSEVVLGASPDPTGPTGRRRPARPDDTGDDPEFASNAVRDGVAAIRDALRAHEHAPTLAAQVAGAVADLLRPLATPAPTVFATTIASTDLFADLVDRIRTDPRACANAYNAAVAHDDTLRPLATADRLELPLWHLDDTTRRPVFADDLADIDPADLAPRALLMTGVMRLAGCDLFVHGTGAGGTDAQHGYEAAADKWLEAWLGEKPRGRVVVATATLTLDLPGADAPTEDDVADAKARAHKARHDPSLVGDDKAAAAKASLIDAIDAKKAAGEKPGPLFAEMQSLLADYRARHEAEFAELDRAAEDLERRLSESDVRTERTWPFPLHPADRLRSMKAEIDRVFGAG